MKNATCNMRLKLLPYPNDKVFGACKLAFHKIDIYIEIFMIHFIKHMFINKLAEFFYINNKSSIGVRETTDGYMNFIVVTMPVFVGTRPKSCIVLFFAPVGNCTAYGLH